MNLPDGLAHGVVHCLALLGALPAAVLAERGLADLNFVILGDILVINGAPLFKLLITFLFLVAPEVRDKGGEGGKTGLKRSLYFQLAIYVDAVVLMASRLLRCKPYISPNVEQ